MVSLARHALLAAVCAGILAGCGFEPLYARRDTDSVADDLARVRIGLIADRSGQVLRNYLLDNFAPRGEAANIRYTLEVKLEEPRQELALRRDDTATRYGYTAIARFVLTDPNGRPVFRSSSSLGTTFEVSDSEFSTLTSRDSARDRIMQQIGEDIRNQVAIYLSGRARQP
ncbi:MAG: hypothetical protein HY057_08470 [Rhodospirillales bacterium]|nr:hypothetical protein [Rhodospirillales bacterium]